MNKSNKNTPLPDTRPRPHRTAETARLPGTRTSRPHTYLLSMTMRYVVIFLFFLTPFMGYGQDLLPKEQEREIKTSGKYFYSECSAFDIAEAKECALRDLTQIVLIDMIREAINTDEVAIKNSIEMQAQMAQLNLTGRIRILAWIEKASTNLVQTTTPETATTTTPVPTTTTETATTTTPVQTTTPETATTTTPVPTTTPETATTTTPVPTTTPETATTTTPVPTTTPETATTEPESASKPDLSTIANPVVRDLVKCDTFEQFRRLADGFRRQGKVVYGTNKTSFGYPEKCLVAVFTTDQKLIAFLDAGQNSRIDFLTGKTIQNVEQQFTGNILYWIQTMD